jgi:hypothetical protein
MAIGTSVQAVLKLADVRTIDPTEFHGLAALRAVRAGIPELEADVTRRAHGVAQTPLVYAAAQSGRHWREVYLAVRDGQETTTSYIGGLLVEDADGRLVVVDYTTHRAQGAAGSTAKAEHYRPQLAADFRSHTIALDRKTSTGALVPAGREGAQQVTVNLSIDGDG